MNDSCDKGSVLITGCSSGIGLTTSVYLAQRGWNVVPSMRNPARGDALLEAYEAAGLAPPAILRLDATDAASVKEAVEQAPRLAAIVANAGIGDSGCFEDFEDEHCRRVMETNFFGTLSLARAVLPQMRAQEHGRLVILSSLVGISGAPGTSMYAASKFALEGWVEGIVCELRAFNISVSLIEPGNHKTSIFEKLTVASRPGSDYRAMTTLLTNMSRGKFSINGADPRHVSVAIAHAIESSRPRMRYRVGNDAKMAGIMRRLLPDSARIAMIEKAVGMRNWRRPNAKK